MERLTKYLASGAADYNYPAGCYSGNDCNDRVAKSAYRQTCVERLAAYEETGLTPEESKRMSNILMDVGIDYNCSWEYVKNWLLDDRLRELDEGVVEAAQSMGATPFQIITKVMIPECLPGLISSMTTALTTILGYSAMSGVIGGGGLGKIALSYGYYRYQTNIMIVCVILLVLLVQIFQTVGTFWATRSDKRLRK